MGAEYISDAKSERQRGELKEGLEIVKRKEAQAKTEQDKKAWRLYKALGTITLDRLTRGRPQYEKAKTKSLKQGK
jgi:hypothetical protein